MTLDKRVRAELETLQNFPVSHPMFMPAAQVLALDNVCKLLAMIVAELQMIREANHQATLTQEKIDGC